MTPQDLANLIRYLMAHPYLTEVALAGPFAGPEANPVDPADPFASRGVRWTRPTIGPTGRIALPVEGQREVRCYVVAEVTAPRPLHTSLQMAAAGTIRAWLNGKPVYQGNPGKTATPENPAQVEVDLQAGRNLLVFQLQCRGGQESFYVRLLDAERVLENPEPNVPGR